MPFLTFMAIKGLISVVAGIGVKTAAILSIKASLAYGIGAAITGALVIGLVVGGIEWTEKCVSSLDKGIKALENGNISDAVLYFAQLAVSSGVGADALPDSIHDYLVQSNVSEQNARIVKEAASELQGEIAKKIIELKERNR
jgi:hypothetical protein